MPIKPVHIQRRMMQLGRVRLGEKGPRGEPKKLNSFRFTSASSELLEAVAAIHGGTVEPWQGAPDEGYFQVTTDATRLDIILPPVYSDQDGAPTVPYSQWFELWSAGGCARRCDGETEALSGKPCMCDPEKRQEGDPKMCKVVTRVSFMLPDLPGLGVWRIDSHGWNAAVELPGTLEVLAQAAQEMKFIPAVLAIQHRTKKSDGQTRRFIVPVIELPDVTVRQLVAGDVPLALNAPVVTTPAGRPALPAAPEPPAEPFQADPPHGVRPALPGEDTSEALTVVELKDRIQHAGIETAMVSDVGGRMFPGKSAGAISDMERGELWKALEVEAASWADFTPAEADRTLDAVPEPEPSSGPEESAFKIPEGVTA